MTENPRRPSPAASIQAAVRENDAAPCPDDAPRRTWLVTVHGPGIGRKIDLEQSEMTIGRGSDNDVVVQLDDISRVHCRIAKRGTGYVVTDLGSTNGTHLNDRRIQANAELPLQHGDLLNLGAVIFKVLDGDDVEAQYHEEVYRTAIVDGLTQIYNRRYLTESLERELARCERHSREASLVLFEVDHFKRINDEHGQTSGDQVLREIAIVVGAGLRKECCFARSGGEEFAIVLPETSQAEARMVAERIRVIVGAHEFVVNGQLIPVSISAGVAVNQPTMRGAASFFQLADTQLSDAKHRGRNRVSG